MKKNIVLLVIFFVLFSTACGLLKSTEDSLKEAKVELKLNKYSSASVILKDILQSEANNGEARFLLGKLYYDTGDYQGAVKEFSKAVEFGWNKNNVVYLWMTSLRNGNSFDELRELLQNESLTSQLDKADVLALQGWEALGHKDQKKSVELFNQSLKLNADNYDALLGKVQLVINDRDLIHANDLLNQILAKYPTDPEAKLMLAMIKINDKQFANAEELLKSVLQHEPEGVITGRALNARLKLISVLMMGDRLDDASKLIGETYSSVPSHPLATYFKGYDLFRLKEYTKSKELLNKVINSIPSHKPSLLLLGSIHYTEENYEQASFFLDRYIKSNPEHTGARKMLGVSQLKLNQADDALLTLQPVLADADLETLKLAGVASFQSGDIKGGLKFLQSAIAADPDDINVRFELARAYLATGEKKEAKSELEKTLKAGEGSEKAFALLTNLHLREGNTQLAIILAEKEVKRNPNSAYYHNALGQFYAMNEAFEKSKKSFEKSIANDDKYWPARLNLAKIFILQKKTDLAEVEFLKLKNEKTNNTVVRTYVRFLLAQKRQADAVTYLKEVTKDEQNLQAANMLLQLYKDAGQTKEYEEYITKIAKSKNGRTLALGLEGRDLLKARNGDDAIRVYRDLVRQNPNSYLGYLDLAKAYLLKKDLFNAEESLKKSLAINPNFVPAIASLSNVYIERKDEIKAEILIDGYIKRNSRSAVGYELKGDVYAIAKKFEKSIQQYEKSLRINQFNTSAVIKLSRAYLKVGDSVKVVSTLKKYIKIAKGDRNYQLRLVLANYYKENKKQPAAIEILSDLGDKFQSDPAKLNDLAWVAHTIDIDLAAKFAKQAHNKLGDMAAVNDTYGWVLLKKGNKNKGLELLAKAHESEPEVKEIEYHYAIALYETGNKKKAKALLRQLKRDKSDFEGKSDIDKYLN